MGCCCSGPKRQSDEYHLHAAADKDAESSAADKGANVQSPSIAVTSQYEKQGEFEGGTEPTHSPSEDVIPSREKGQRRRVIYIVYHSVNGLVEQIVRAFEKGVGSLIDVECHRIPNMLPQAARSGVGVTDKPHDHLVISPDFLPEACGLVFAFPVRFGMMSAPMKAFFDDTGDIWQEGELSGVPVTCVTSSEGNMGGSQTAIFAAATQLVHHGMLFVPSGCSSQQAAATDASEAPGPWGSGAAAGDRPSPAARELTAAQAHGAAFASVVVKLAPTLL